MTTASTGNSSPDNSSPDNSTDDTIPATAARTVEFVSATNYSGGSELQPASVNIDLGAYRTWVRTLESAGFDYTLNGYGAGSADSFIVATATGQLTEHLKPIVALRPNTTFPLVAAQSLATLDQLTEGRAVVHLISGGSDAEQARQGDYLAKDDRYARTSEYIDLLRRAWTEPAPFSYAGRFYRFDDFGPGFRTYSGAPVPISSGGHLMRPSRSAGPRPTGSPSGASRWPRCARRSTASTPSPTRPAGPTRASGSPSARSSPKPTRWPGRRPTRSSVSWPTGSRTAAA